MGSPGVPTRTPAVARFWHGLVGPVGPGAGTAILGTALASAGAVGMRTSGPSWRRAVMAAMAFDIVGGMVAFQLPETRAAYARKSPAAHLGFVASHVHPAVMAALGEGSWRRAAARYAVVVGATAGLERAGLSASGRRAAATALGLAAAGVDLASDRSGAPWFGPTYHLKLVAGHAGIGSRPSAAPPATA